MSGLLVRLVREGDVGVLRSVGDPPNGILTIIHPDDGAEIEASWAVDPNYVPPTDEQVVGFAVDQRDLPGGRGPNAVPLTAGELVAALDGRDDAHAVWQLVLSGVFAAADRFVPAGRFEILIADARLAIETRDALAEAGYMGPVGGGG